MLLATLVLAVATAVTPPPTMPTPRASSLPVALYAPMPCSVIAQQAGVKGPLLTGHASRDAETLGKLFTQAIKDHNGDSMPIQSMSIQRAAIDLFGNGKMQGCMRLQ